MWDVHGEEVTYDLDESQGKRNPMTIWQIYQDALAQAQRIVAQTEKTDPAYCGACKLCHWYTAWVAELESADDLTLLPDLGRAKRDVMVDRIPTVSDLATINVDGFISGKKTAFIRAGRSTSITTS